MNRTALIVLALCSSCQNVDDKTMVLAENVLFEGKSTSSLESATVQGALEEMSPDLGVTLIGEWSTECYGGGNGYFETPGRGHVIINALDDVSHTGVFCLTRDEDGTGWTDVNKLKPIGNRALLVSYDWTIGTDSGVDVQARTVIELTPDRIVVETQNRGVEILTRVLNQ